MKALNKGGGMNKNEIVEEYYRYAIKERLFSKRIKYYMERLFQGLPFEGKRVLDIGGGTGVFSFYAASMGAKRVVCLEPEADGSTSGVTQRFKDIQATLKYEAEIEQCATTIQAFNDNRGKFDVILSHNSINHLDEDACINLMSNPVATETYRAIFKKLGDLAEKGATLVVADSARKNLWDLLHLTNPFVPTIEWEKHAHPKDWAALLAEGGFGNPQIRWLAFTRLGHAGQAILGNEVASYFLDSFFCLTMKKQG
jgi:SAM-dependent methyltransferase